MNHERQRRASAAERAEWFYSLLLSLYPAEHRVAYQVTILQLFRDIYRQEMATRGFSTVLKFWAFVLRDAVISIIREHINHGGNAMSTVSFIKPNTAAAVGLVLLAMPAYFIGASLIGQNAPGLALLGHPIVLLGALFVAFSLNLLSTLSLSLRRDVPAVVTVSLLLRGWNIAIVGLALIFLGALLGYQFVENFQARPPA